MATDFSQYSTGTKSYITARHLWIMLLLVLSVSCGIAVLFVDPIIIIGLIGLSVMAVVLFKYPYLGILVYFLFEYARLSAMFPALQQLQIGKLIIVPTLAIWLIRHALSSESRIVRDPVYSLMAIWFLIAVASTALAYELGPAIQATFDLTKWFIICFLVINLVDDLRKWQGVMWLYLLLNFKMSQFQIRAYYAGLGSAGNSAYYIQQGVGAGSTGYFANATDFGMAMVIALPFALYLALTLKNKLLKFLLFGATASFTLSILHSGSRGAAVAMVAVGFFYWLQSGRKLVPLVATIVFVASFWLVAPDAWKERFQSAEDYESDSTASYRIELWKVGAAMVVDHPVFGVGIGNFGHALDHGYRTPALEGGATVAHNIFVQAATELGLAGLAVVLAIMVLIFKRNRLTRKIYDESDIDEVWIPNFSYALDLALIGFIVGGMFLTVLYYPYLYTILALTVALHRIGRDRVEAEVRKLKVVEC